MALALVCLGACDDPDPDGKPDMGSMTTDGPVDAKTTPLVDAGPHVDAHTAWDASALVDTDRMLDMEVLVDASPATDVCANAERMDSHLDVPPDLVSSADAPTDSTQSVDAPTDFTGAADADSGAAADGVIGNCGRATCTPDQVCYDPWCGICLDRSYNPGPCAGQGHCRCLQGLNQLCSPLGPGVEARCLPGLVCAPLALGPWYVCQRPCPDGVCPAGQCCRRSGLRDVRVCSSDPTPCD